jgi:hypothetical protein
VTAMMAMMAARSVRKIGAIVKTCG